MGVLRIGRLGAVADYKLDIKNINVLIGEQATGKSTICKAVYFFRLVKNEIVEYLFRLSTVGHAMDYDPFPKALNTATKDIFIQLFGPSWELPEELCAEYYFDDEISITVRLNRKDENKYIDVQYSKKLINEVKKIEKESLDFYDKQSKGLSYSYVTSERYRLHSDILKEINRIFKDDMETYYIPAGRSMLTLMANQKTKLDYTQLDLTNRNFMQFIESIQPKFERGIAQVHNYYSGGEREDIQEVIRELLIDLKGDYYFHDGKEYLMVDDYKIQINYISSGQQEILWLLNQLYVLLLQKEKSFLVIEEPETHLYPKLQKRIIEFIIKFANMTGSTVLITTHSPYILTCINTLCYAGKIIMDSGRKAEVEEIIGKYMAIMPEMIYAGKLIYEQGQTKVENLIIEELKELYTELIDEVSDENNETYTRLCELEGDA